MMMKPLRQPPPALMIASGMLVTLVAVAFARLAYGLILPFMRQSLGLTYQQAGNLGTASALGYLCFVMAAGMLAARRGGRFAILLGMLLTTAGFAGLAAGGSYAWLAACMLLLGLGTAFSFTPVISLLATWFPKRRGAVIGVVNSGIGVGMLLAGALVPWLNTAHPVSGWRLTWGAFGLVSLMAMVSSYAFLRNPPRPAAAATAARTQAAPVHRNPHVVTVGMLYGVVGLTYIAQSVFMVSFALASGVPPTTAGRLAAMMGLLSVFSGPGWGWVSDRAGRAASLTAAVSLNLCGTLVPVLWQTQSAFFMHYLIVGLTSSGMFTSVLAASSERVEPQQAPLAVSFVTLFYAAGQFLGPALAGVMIEEAGGFRTAFATSCVILASGVLLCLRLRTLGKRAQCVPAG
ncbi:MFS transporter [Noviherbaspirillum pedocola]|uniref:YbfB/YjiJ family MFS transporter n=1 Tax=Noviherbaspirillum pedocola TaxID=2801341 RepID=A0A934T422_9BURK|nr:MFS transporter [Noviherbaspirillum pedocola]MBK4738458.1 YbfB/YjiJ family MFS transporter [Noviherbaspirillum pedocola]